MNESKLGVIAVLGTTQTLAWASTYYLPAILADRISSELGMTSSWFFAAFSGSLVVAAMVGPRDGMGHGVPLATTGVHFCGVTGPFFLEAGLCSTSQIARFWGLDTAEAREWRSATRSGAGRESPAPSLPALPAGDYAPADDMPLRKDAGSRDKHLALDPNVVIAAAFKAAGLAAPEETGQPGSRRVDPAGIVAAALKAAGLTRS